MKLGNELLGKIMLYSRVFLLFLALAIVLFSIYFNNILWQIITVTFEFKGTIAIGIDFFTIFNNIHVLYAAALVLLLGLSGIASSRCRGWKGSVLYATSFCAVNGLLLAHMGVTVHAIGLLVFGFVIAIAHQINMLQYEAMKKPAHYAMVGVFCFVPVIADLLFPSFLLYSLRRARVPSAPYPCNNGIVKKIWRPVCLTFCFEIFVLVVLAFGIVTGRIGVEIRHSPRTHAVTICRGEFYVPHIDRQTDRLFASRQDTNELYVFDLKNLDAGTVTVCPIQTEEFEWASLNETERELYHLDRGTDRVIVYDIDSFKVLRKSPFPLEGSGSARITIDNRSHTIAIRRENDTLWIIDMKTLIPLKKYDLFGRKSEDIVFCHEINRYILSYYDVRDRLRCVATNGENLLEPRAYKHQGAIAVSPKNREVYVAMPLRGSVLVYDMDTFLIVREMPSVFGARGIVYDEVHNVLLVASLVTGYVDVIDLSAYMSVNKIFVGYYLRNMCLDIPHRRAFIAGRRGLYTVDY